MILPQFKHIHESVQPIPPATHGHFVFHCPPLQDISLGSCFLDLLNVSFREVRQIAYVPFIGESIRGVTAEEISTHIALKSAINAGNLCCHWPVRSFSQRLCGEGHQADNQRIHRRSCCPPPRNNERHCALVCHCSVVC